MGTPVFDAHLIDVGRGFEARDNANLQENAETSHKKKADKISKEQYLLQLPPDLADHHLRGDLHIHDLEYFGTRPFCIDGSTAIPVRTDNRIRSILPAELPFTGDEWRPEDLSALTPKGWRRVSKVTRRRVTPGEMIRIRTSSGRSLSVTGEHRIPVQTRDGMAIRRADEVCAGDTLYGIPRTDAIRGETIEAIDLVRELPASVPAHLLENVYVRGAEEIFADVVRIGKAASYADISRALGVEHQKQWYTRGIMPVALFAAFSRRYGIRDYGQVTIGVTGSGNELPALFTLTPELIRLLGFFVAEGNCNEAGRVQQSQRTPWRPRSGSGCAQTPTQHSPEAPPTPRPSTGSKWAYRAYGSTSGTVYLIFHTSSASRRRGPKTPPWIVYHLTTCSSRVPLRSLHRTVLRTPPGGG